MKAIDSSMVRIRADEVIATQPWDLPVVKSGHVVALNELRPAVEEDVIEDEVVAEKLTLSELESIREEARQEGYAEGHKSGLEAGTEEGRNNGYQEGKQKARKEIDLRNTQFAELIKQLEQPLDQVNSDVEAMLVSMVMELSRAVVNAELNTNAEAVQRAVQDAVNQLPRESGTISILVNSQQVSLLDELQAQHDNWQVTADDSIQPGGCRVVTGNAVVDNSVESRFQAVASQLQAHLTESDAAASPDSQV